MKQEYDFSKGRRGAVVPVPQGKTRVTIRLDDDLLDCSGMKSTRLVAATIRR